MTGPGRVARHDVPVGLMGDVVVDRDASDVHGVVVQPGGALAGLGWGRARLAIPLRVIEELPARL